MDTPLDQARAALLSALEELDEAAANLDAAPERVDLCVVYSIGRRVSDDNDWHEVGGWASTPGPSWLHAALLRRAADAQADSETDDDE